jgi:predicted DNA-binding transcriptional regulator AlpA
MTEPTSAEVAETPNITDRGQDSGPILLLAAEAAALCRKSLRAWRSWDSAGLIPRPIRIGRSTLWRADELREWIAAGCPCRDNWDAQRNSADTQ